jgi:flagellar hook-associated protein 3 FlgL
MITIGQSDLASAMKLSEQNTRTKMALEVASSELSNSMKDNLVEATAGDLGKLFAIDRTLSRLSSEADAIHLAGGKSAIAQTALGNIHENLVDFGPQLLSAVERGDTQSSRLIASDARHALGAVVTSLNVRYGRHSIFAGAALDQQAVAPTEVIISDITAIVAGAADSTVALIAIDDYFFSPAGGFETNIFLGATQDGPPFRDENGEIIEYAQRADSFGIRNAIRALTIAVVASDAPNFMNTPDQVDLLREAGNSAISATGDITTLRETLGFAEGRIENAEARNQSMSGVFELERAAIISADPYETATKFEALQVQLQTIYTITARLSNLSLMNFLR